MSLLRDPARRLSALLFLVALHSVLVGVGLIWHPSALMTRMGFDPCHEPFFPTQGGVFHVLMAVGYALAAVDLQRNRCLALFTVVVKTTATIFLILYWGLAGRQPVVLFSGLGDGAMAIAVAWAYVSWRRSTNESDP